MDTARRARLRLIRGDGVDGFTFQLKRDQHVAGRTEGPICFPDDATVSPTHALFAYREGRLWVADLDSHNGIFMRLREPHPLRDNDVFLCGEQVLRFNVYRKPKRCVGGDGAVFGGTPVDRWRFRLEQQLTGGVGMAHCARKRKIGLGRDACDLNFPDDQFISRHHCSVEEREDGFVLTDLGSRNRTYIRLRKDRALKHDDHLFIGRQLLRVELS